MYRKTLQTSVAAAALFAFAAPFAGPVSAAGNTIVNGKSQVKVAITGQVSRVVAVVDDGNTTNIHHGSNQFSGNRVRFIGTAKAWESLTIGTRIEFQFNNRTSNESGNFTRAAPRTRTPATTPASTPVTRTSRSPANGARFTSVRATPPATARRRSTSRERYSPPTRALPIWDLAAASLSSPTRGSHPPDPNRQPQDPNLQKRANKCLVRGRAPCSTALTA